MKERAIKQTNLRFIVLKSQILSRAAPLACCTPSLRSLALLSPPSLLSLALLSSPPPPHFLYNKQVPFLASGAPYRYGSWLILTKVIRESSSSALTHSMARFASLLALQLCHLFVLIHTVQAAEKRYTPIRGDLKYIRCEVCERLANVLHTQAGAAKSKAEAANKKFRESDVTTVCSTHWVTLSETPLLCLR